MTQTYTNPSSNGFHEEVELQGHIIDSLLLPKIMDEILTHGGVYELQQIEVGQRPANPSYARIKVQAHTAAELEERVAAARRELEELDRAKSAFVAIASHELRTPLTALQGFSEILAVRRLPPEEVNRLYLEEGSKIAKEFYLSLLVDRATSRVAFDSPSGVRFTRASGSWMTSPEVTSSGSFGST